MYKDVHVTFAIQFITQYAGMQFEEMCCKNAVALKKNAISKNV